MSNTPHGVGDGSNAKEFTAVPFKDATAKASDPRVLPTVEREFIWMGDLRRLFGITRKTAYRLAQRCKSQTLFMCQVENRRSVHLGKAVCVRTYLRGLLEGKRQRNLLFPCKKLLTALPRLKSRRDLAEGLQRPRSGTAEECVKIQYPSKHHSNK